jgi:tRNA nucleotidyltransferase (CCA-adding enzyme)
MVLPPSLSQAVVPAPVLDVVKRLIAGGFEAFLVGGCVRDYLRGVEPKDFDIATSALPEEVQRLFRKVIPTGLQHGTVTVMQGTVGVEVTTFRSEGEYLDGRRPSQVNFHRDIEADLSRRDFTINAMAFCPPQQRLVDPFDGQGDLQRKRICCVGKPTERFHEDGLRALRAVRFATVLNFDIEPKTLQSIALTLPTFKKISLERVNTEFVKILSAPGVTRGLTLLADTGLLDAFLPGIAPERFDAVGAAPPHLLPRLVLLLVGWSNSEETLMALKFPNKLSHEVAHVLRYGTLPSSDADDESLRRFLSQLGLKYLPVVLQVARANGTADALRDARLEALAQSNPPLAPQDLALNGADIMRILNISPSKAVGRASAFLLDHVLRNPANNTVESLTELLRSSFNPDRQ